MNPLLEFQSTLATLEETNTTLSQKSSSFQNYLNNQKDKIWRKHYPKKKKVSYDLLSQIEDYKNLNKKIQEKLAPKFWDFWRGKQDKLKEKLYELAANLQPEKTADYILWRTSSSDDFGSQGYGCCAYANNRAKGWADKAIQYGLEVDIRFVDKGSHGHYCIQHGDYEVWVKTNEIGLNILNYGRNLPFLEIIRSMLKRGE